MAVLQVGLDALCQMLKYDPQAARDEVPSILLVTRKHQVINGLECFN